VVLRSILYFLILIVIITIPVYSQGDFALNINSGYFGVGGSFPDSENENSGLSLALVSIGIEHKLTNIGFVFCPFAFYDLTDFYENGNGANLNYSFINLKLYWNVLTVLDDFIYFGPFASVNYLFAGDNVHWDRYVFTAGGHIGFRLSYRGINYDLLSTEMGYRNVNGRGMYFVGVKVDMLALFLTLLIWGSDD